MYIYIYTYIYTHTHIYIYAYVYVYIDVYTNVCMYTCTYIDTLLCVQVHMLNQSISLSSSLSLARSVSIFCALDPSLHCSPNAYISRLPTCILVSVKRDLHTCQKRPIYMCISLVFPLAKERDTAIHLLLPSDSVSIFRALDRSPFLAHRCSTHSIMYTSIMRDVISTMCYG